MCACFEHQFERKNSALCGTSEKGKSKGFFFGSRHTRGDKLGVSLGGVLDATTIKS